MKNDIRKPKKISGHINKGGTDFHPLNEKSGHIDKDAAIFHPLNKKSGHIDKDAAIFHPLNKKSGHINKDAAIFHPLNKKSGHINSGKVLFHLLNDGAYIFPAFMLDAAVGDPENFPHPVRLIGKTISFLEKKLRRDTDSPNAQRAKGTLLAAAISAGTYAAGKAVMKLVGAVSPKLEFAVGTVLSCYCLAARNLRDSSMRVCEKLETGDIDGARQAVSMIVGRDTSVLDADGIARAAVETVAENTADGVIAPLFYMSLLGVPGALAYKAVNTMDSMLGYKNDKYRYFGTAAARLDDITGFIPARVSGLLITAAAFVCGMDGKNAWKIFKRDRYKHASPNSAQSESAMAGALDLQLAGDAKYFGKWVHKEYIGDPIKEIEPADIRRANIVMYTASAMAAVLFTAWPAATVIEPEY